MRASALVLVVLLGAPALLAQDLGTRVTFGSKSAGRFPVRVGPSAPRVLYDSDPSDPISGDWDTVLISGELPDAAVRLFAARPGGPTLGPGGPTLGPGGPTLGPGAPLWVEFSVKRFPDGRFWAKAQFARGFGDLALRIVDAGIVADCEVSLYGVEVFAVEPESRASVVVPPRGPMDPSALPPPAHGRAEWNAAPPKEPYWPDPLPWRLTLHHTDGRFTASLAASLAETRFIQDFHQHGRGWNDIGYHYLVDALGNILEGRPIETLGAHTLNHNVGNVGIALLGAYHAPSNDTPTRVQLDAVAALGRYLVKRFGLGRAALSGHRDYRPTPCPGDRAYPRLDELREALGNAPG